MVDGRYNMGLETESDLTLTNYFRVQYTFIPAIDLFYSWSLSNAYHDVYSSTIVVIATSYIAQVSTAKLDTYLTKIKVLEHTCTYLTAGI